MLKIDSFMRRALGKKDSQCEIGAFSIPRQFSSEIQMINWDRTFKPFAVKILIINKINLNLRFKIPGTIFEDSLQHL